MPDTSAPLAFVLAAGTKSGMECRGQVSRVFLCSVSLSHTLHLARVDKRVHVVRHLGHDVWRLAIFTGERPKLLTRRSGGVGGEARFASTRRAEQLHAEQGDGHHACPHCEQ